MTIRTESSKAIIEAAKVSGMILKTLRPIVDKDWMVDLDHGTNDPKAALLGFLSALFAADPTARVMVGKTWVDATTNLNR